MNFSPFPDLQSKRLRLRAPKNSDYVALSALRSNEEVNRFIDRPKSCDLAEAYAFILKIQKNIAENISVYWVITTAESDELIGTVCLCARPGYCDAGIFCGMKISGWPARKNLQATMCSSCKIHA